MASPLLLRPHHGLCIQNFRGKGYSENFVRVMAKIAAFLEENPEQEITLHTAADAVCAACPHKTEQNGCDSGQKVLCYDENCLSLLNLRPGDTLPWEEYRDLLRKAVILPRRYRKVCKGCQWIAICEGNTPLQKEKSYPMNFADKIRIK